MNGKLLLVALAMLLVIAPSAGATGTHHLPVAGDRFHYFESIALSGGTGNYSGYEENTFINGTEGVTGVLPNGTESANYQDTATTTDNSGYYQPSSESGNYTFSALTFLYVQGTDNQTGYTNPFVWFYIDNSLPVGSSFSLLNSEFTLVNTSTSYPTSASPSGYASTLFGEGNGTYQRNDDYGNFAASYNWKVYFDPATGYIVGYVYTETDTDGAGDGFTITDQLSVTSTTYPLTQDSAPPAVSSGSGSSGIPLVELLALVLLVVVIVAAIVAVVVLRSRRRTPIPRHSAGGAISYAPPPGMAPPTIRLTPSDQPAVQQIVMRETVKVNCQYCEALIDSTATACPSCGAPRT